ncbi:MAG: glycoside hydrolase family 130 protein [Clostridiaceae bacterium]|nr:glycoside hydrolase family 130 protein [Clostridiaceae bacterium]
MNGKMNPILISSEKIKRYEHNPILSAKDIPYEADLIFNAGVVKYQGKYVMIFRNDYGYIEGSRFKGTNLGLAFSDDGVSWRVQDKPFFSMEDIQDDEISRLYDPRLTVIDGRCYVCFAVDTRHGLRGGIGVTDDFNKLEIISMTVPDNRNMVLFPEKINGLYTRLERPMPVYSRGKDRFDTWLSKSPDLKFWGESSLILPVEAVPFANDKTGPAAPPIKTKKGWLTTFHAVDIDASRGKNGWEPYWKKRYCAGIMLLDLENPEKIIGMSKEPLIAPETVYEATEGFRTNVIFPGGMILEESGEVKIYYGASDTVECLATAHVDDLLELCKPM